MNCPNCNSPNNDGARFCTVCGAAIPQPDATTASPTIDPTNTVQPQAQPQYAQQPCPQQPQYGQQQPQYAQPQPMGESASILDIVLGFFLPVLGVIFYVMKKDRLSNPETLLYSAGIGAVCEIVFALICFFFYLFVYIVD